MSSPCFSALQRAEIAEIQRRRHFHLLAVGVSVLFNEPKLLKFVVVTHNEQPALAVSVLFNEPKLLKFNHQLSDRNTRHGFSALQRAEIAEIECRFRHCRHSSRFSALQRAEIAEIVQDDPDLPASYEVSVLFNEPKLLKLCHNKETNHRYERVSVLFNEPKLLKSRPPLHSASLFHIPITTLRRS